MIALLYDKVTNRGTYSDIRGRSNGLRNKGNNLGCYNIFYRLVISNGVNNKLNNERYKH